MNKLPSRLRRLDDALADLPAEDEAMFLSELDGFLTALLLCPDTVMPGEWLPLVWGGDGRPPYDDPADVQWLADMLVARRAEIARDLARGKPRPLFDIDGRSGEALWDLWMAGFASAMDLRPESWSAIARGEDSGLAETLAEMTTLAEIAGERSVLTSIEINAICDEAAASIPRLVMRLYEGRAGPGGAAAEAEPLPARIGRNDPCACGSGRKHKRCCGSL